MKKILIATVATAALLVAAPAFAQPEATTQTEAETATSVTPPTLPTDQLPEVTTANPNAADTETQAEAEASVATPESERLPTASGDVAAEAESATTAEAPAAAVTTRAVANGELRADLPAQVDEAIADGRYTPDDLNRDQLAALQGSSPPATTP